VTLITVPVTLLINVPVIIQRFIQRLAQRGEEAGLMVKGVILWC
jgi:hypothetical protein